MCARFGRKPLFFVAGITMFIMQTATAALTGLTFTGGTIPQEPANAMIVFICIFVSCFAFSWGPLGWLVRPHPFHLPLLVSPFHTFLPALPPLSWRGAAVAALPLVSGVSAIDWERQLGLIGRDRWV